MNSHIQESSRNRQLTVDELRESVASGEIDTVIVAITDALGRLGASVAVHVPSSKTFLITARRAATTCSPWMLRCKPWTVTRCRHGKRATGTW